KVSREEGETLAESLGVPFFEASAKTQHNVEEVFREACRIRDADYKLTLARTKRMKMKGKKIPPLPFITRNPRRRFYANPQPQSRRHNEYMAALENLVKDPGPYSDFAFVLRSANLPEARIPAHRAILLTNSGHMM